MRLKWIWVLLLIVTPAFAQSPSTYYIDIVSGSNANDGKTKNTAWASHPYMQGTTGCAGAVHSYTHVAGDHFIFKGGTGETWTAPCFSLVVAAGGTVSAQDYYGVDLTWFNGATFTRPLFDMNYTYVGPAVNFASGVNYVTFDNFEVYRMLINVTGTYTGTGYAFRASGATYPITIKNSYMHDWGTNGPFQDSSYGDWGAGCIGGGTVSHPAIAIMDHSTCSDANGYFIDKNGVRHNGLGFDGACENCAEVTDGSTFHDTGAACFSVKLCHDSEFFNINADAINQYCNALGSGCHGQVIENDNPIYQMQVYNNFIHGNTAAEIIGTARGDSVYNNVISGNGGSNGNSILLDSFDGFGSGQTTSVYNNTEDCNGGNCVRFINRSVAFGTANIRDNLWINPSTPAINTNGVTGITGTQDANYPMSLSEASNHGYTLVNKYSPSDSLDTNTINAGINVTSLCSGTLAQLCSDPEGAKWFGGAYVSRPNSACDIGAMQHPPSNSSPPTVTVTAPTNNSTVTGTATLTATCVPVSPATIQANSFLFQVDGSNFGTAGSASPYSVTWDTTTASNATHTITATCNDSNGVSGGSSTITVTVNNTLCASGFTTDVPWIGNIGFTAQTSTFTITWCATPDSGTQDTVQGLSNGAAAQYSDLATSVRFGGVSGSQIQALDSTSYRADNVVTWTSGTQYCFSEIINFTTHQYSVQLTSPSNVTICAACNFRNTQSGVTQLDHFNGESANPTPNTVKDCSVAIAGALVGPACIIQGNTIILQGVTIQ